MMLTYILGDATNPIGNGNKIITHICNDLGLWGKGFVLAISKRWKLPEEKYKEWYKEKSSFQLGQVRFVQVEDTITIANMLAQRGIKRKIEDTPIDYLALQECLIKVTSYAKETNASVHMPRIGTGLAGGDWSKIELIIRNELVNKGIPTTVYDYT